MKFSREPIATVVMPVRNGAAHVDQQLASLAVQPGLAHERGVPLLELVVVDNGSTDDTIDRVRRWTARIPSLRVVRAASRQGPSHARNAGIVAAASDLLLLCDADDRVAPDWSEKLTAALADASVVAGGVAGWEVGGQVRGSPLGSQGFGFLPAFATCNAALRRSVWEAVGGFDESLLTCEDIDFSWRVQLAGFVVASCPAAVVHHRDPQSAAGEFRAWFAYGRYQPRLMRRFGADGLMPEPVGHALAKWAQILLTANRLAGNDETRRTWCREAGRRAGRLVGSVREHTLYL